MINILFFYTQIYMIYSKFDASGIVDTECKIHTRYIHVHKHVHANLEEIIDKIILYTDVFLCIKFHKFHLGLHVQYAIHNLLLPDSINLNIRNRSSICTILQINNYIFLSDPLLFSINTYFVLLLSLVHLNNTKSVLCCVKTTSICL